MPPLLMSPRSRTIEVTEYIGAIGDEYKAVERYERMIGLSTDPDEIELLTHILEEELEHLKELKHISKVNGEHQRDGRCDPFAPPDCGCVERTNDGSDYVEERACIRFLKSRGYEVIR